MLGNLIAALALVLSGAEQAPQAEPMKNPELRILTFNIKHGSTMNGDFDLERIAGVIRDAAPDLVALQEVDVKTGRARNLDLASELAHRTGMAAAFGKAMDFDGGEYGNAILSKHGIEQAYPLMLPYSGEHEQRGALVADISLPEGGRIRFVSTHLEVAAEEDRLAQARMINDRLARDGAPAILAGDFNAEPGSATMAELGASWVIACGDRPAPTFPSDDPQIKIDYVLYRPAGAWEVVETKVIQDAIASDHCAYLAVLAPAGE